MHSNGNPGRTQDEMEKEQEYEAGKNDGKEVDEEAAAAGRSSSIVIHDKKNRTRPVELPLTA